MKKIIIMSLLVVAFIYNSYKVNAMGNEYVNLLDMNQVQYDEIDNIFYSDQKIELTKDLSYTLVATTNFFGDKTKANSEALVNDVIGTNFVSSKGDKLILDLILNYSEAGLY